MVYVIKAHYYGVFDVCRITHVAKTSCIRARGRRANINWTRCGTRGGGNGGIFNQAYYMEMVASLALAVRAIKLARLRE